MKYIPISLNLLVLKGIKQEKLRYEEITQKVKNKLTVFSSKVLPPRDDIRVEFTGTNLTKFGGIQLVRKFLIRFGVKEELQRAVSIEKRDSRFSVGGMLVCLL